MAVLGGLLLGGLALRVSGYWPPSRSDATPTPGPTAVIALDPDMGQPGAAVKVTGAGWPAGEMVKLRLAAPNEALLSPVDVLTATVAQDGTFGMVFSVPEDRPWSEVEALQVMVETASAQIRVVKDFEVLPADPTATPIPPTVTSTATPTSSPTPTATPMPPTATPTRQPATATPEANGWRGEYFNNITFAGRPAVVRTDAALDFDWGRQPPVAGVLSDGFAVRWTRTLPLTAGAYRFYATADDGVRVWLDNQLLINEWHDAQAMTYTETRTLGGGNHTFTVEYYEAQGDAHVQFWWEPTEESGQWRGEYFANPSLEGDPALVRDDGSVSFDWGRNAPAAGLPVDNFSARWTRTLAFEAGTYRFRLLVDDGARLYVDGKRVIDAWGNGAEREVTAEVPLAAGNHTLRVEYYEASGDALIQVGWETHGTYADWRGEYWTNTSLSGLPALVRNDKTLDFDWGRGAPAASLPADGFSARWTRTLAFDAGAYRFYVTVDDGARLWIDNRLVLDAWQDGSSRQLTVDVTLAAGEHTVQLAYYEQTREARVRLAWEELEPTATPTPTATATPSPTPKPTLTPTATATPTPTPTRKPTATPTATLTPTATATPTSTATATSTPTPTSTPTSSATPTATPDPETRPKPPVRINEVAPAAGDVDWNEDGRIDAGDAWVELYNATSRPVDLSSWALQVIADAEYRYVFPEEVVLAPESYLVLYSSETGMIFTDGELRLVRDPVVMDGVSLDEDIQANASLSRDDLGVWHSDWLPTPGGVNRPMPPGARGR